MQGSGSPASRPYGLESAVSVRRFVNDEIASVAARWGDQETEFEFICECGDLSCRVFLKMTLADYHESTPGSVIAHR